MDGDNRFGPSLLRLRIIFTLLALAALAFALCSVGTAIILSMFFLAPLLAFLPGILLAAVVVLYAKAARCPHCRAQLKIYASSLAGGQGVFCPRCGEEVHFR